jgi:hypothetical protein
MKMKFAIRFSMLWILASVVPAFAGPGQQPLYLRLESGTCIYHASTCQTVETTAGTSNATLAFSGTTTYNFYSPPLATPMPLTTADTVSGTVWMKNAAPTAANNFAVTAKFQYLDYNPNTGTESLIVGTPNSVPQTLNSGDTEHWLMEVAALPSAVTVPAGHLLHIAVTVTLVSGNPGGYGQLLYNGPSGHTSIGQLANSSSPAWSFGAPVTCQPNMVSIQMMPDKCAQLGCLGMPNQSYLIQATSDLKSGVWTTIATNTSAADGCYSHIDEDATNYPCRFYRTVAP